MVIRFRPGKLGEKPDSLTRRWDVYLKEGDKDYATINPHNFRPVFTNKQLSQSLRATYLLEPVLRAATILDIETIHSDILSGYRSDNAIPVLMDKAKSSDEPRWSIDTAGFLRHDDRLYIPDANDLRLRITASKHDHITAGHYGQNKTTELIRREYTWPNLRSFARDYCSSCTTC